MQEIRFTIADISFSISGELPTILETPPVFTPFSGGSGEEVTLRLHQRKPDLPFGDPIFSCESVWTLYQQNGTKALAVFQDPRFPGQERTLVFSHPIKEVDLFLHGDTSRPQDPFLGPTFPLLMIHYLARGKGAMIHSCGIEKDGRGVLFVGDSGAGKTTLAKLWGEEEDVRVLSDERMILRKTNDRLTIYGTPWHGDGNFASPGSGELRGVCLLNQGKENRLERIFGLQAVSRLTQSAFPPHWDPRGMAFTIDLFSETAAKVPCYLFTFRPDVGAVRLIEESLL